MYSTLYNKKNNNNNTKKKIIIFETLNKVEDSVRLIKEAKEFDSFFSCGYKCTESNGDRRLYQFFQH